MMTKPITNYVSSPIGTMIDKNEVLVYVDNPFEYNQIDCYAFPYATTNESMAKTIDNKRYL